MCPFTELHIGRQTGIKYYFRVWTLGDSFVCCLALHEMCQEDPKCWSRGTSVEVTKAER